MVKCVLLAVTVAYACGALAQDDSRPRQYCAATTPAGDAGNVCIDLREYSVSAMQPAQGNLAGQQTRIIGANFPTLRGAVDPANTIEIQCRFGEAAPSAAVVMSSSEIACTAPPAVGTGPVTVFLQLCLGDPGVCGPDYTTDALTFNYLEAEPETGLSFSGISPLQWFSYGAWVMVASGIFAVIVGVTCFLRRRGRANKDTQSGIPAGAIGRYAAEWAGQARSKEEQLDEALLQAQLSSDAQDKRTQRCACCKGPTCCLIYGLMGLVLLGSGITSVIFTRNLVADEVDGIPQFETLAPVEKASTSMTISWSYPLNEAERPDNLQYEIQITADASTISSLSTVSEWTTVYFGSDEEFSFTDLRAASRYGFRLRFLENSIASQWSTTAFFETQLTKSPGAPDRPIIISTSEDSISLAWSAPQSNGAPIDDPYFAVRDPDSGDEAWLPTGSPELSTVQGGLDPGGMYTFQVRAHNLNGWGDGSAPVEATCNEAGATVPDAPRAPLASGQSSATRLGILVGDDNMTDVGAPTLAFGLDMQGGAVAEFTRVFSGAGLQNISVEDLEQNTTYQFRMCAINSLGVSDFSESVELSTREAETPFKVPEFTQTEIWLSRARLRWTAPASEGSAIERYEIQMEDETGGDIKNYTFDASVTETDIPDALRASTSYATQIRAVNAIGPGEWNNISVLTYNPGACSNDADAQIWNDNMATFSTDMGTCCLSCLGLGPCFTNCWRNNLGYSDDCTSCWASTCSCASFSCLQFCIGGPSAACDECVIERCNPTTSACTGLPPDFIPRG